MNLTLLLTFCAAKTFAWVTPKVNESWYHEGLEPVIDHARITCDVDQSRHPDGLQISIEEQTRLKVFLDCKDDQGAAYRGNGYIGVYCGLPVERTAEWVSVFSADVYPIDHDRSVYIFVPSRFPIADEHRGKHMECRLEESMNVGGDYHSIYIDLV